MQEEPVHSDSLPLFVANPLLYVPVTFSQTKAITRVKLLMCHECSYTLCFIQYIVIFLSFFVSASVYLYVTKDYSQCPCVFFFSVSHCVAHSKSVSWLLGCDGDVQVIVIGEMDEFKASKILRSGLGERKAASLRYNSQYGHVPFSSVSMQHSQYSCIILQVILET